MKKIIPVLITFLSIGLIVYGASYFIKGDTRKYNLSKNSQEEAEEEKKEEVKDEVVLSEPEYDANKEKVKLYLFWGNGCPHCQEAEEWFDEIEPTYGKYFEVVAYEVWYSEENAELMKKVGSYLGKDVEGVPFIVIGDTSYGGFANVYKEKILNTIFDEYKKDERVDVVKNIESNM